MGILMSNTLYQQHVEATRAEVLQCWPEAFLRPDGRVLSHVQDGMVLGDNWPAARFHATVVAYFSKQSNRTGQEQL